MKAKPFVKWAGGKTNLLSQLDTLLPPLFAMEQDVTYVEPFVGGGAMLFYMLNTYPNIRKVIINDINKDLIETYRIIKSNPKKLINRLKRMEEDFLAIPSEDERRNVYLTFRDYYNSLPYSKKFERVVYFMFINHTCFNGLYRENRSGKYNVPFGRYAKPTICHEDVIMAVHEKLQNVDIYCGSYDAIADKIEGGNIFVYFDPPYRPLSDTSNFNDYNSTGFGDKDQEALKAFCDELTLRGCKIMLSNSDSDNKDGSSYFENLFETSIDTPTYNITRVLAHRYINAFAAKREKATEVVIRNY